MHPSRACGLLLCVCVLQVLRRRDSEEDSKGENKKVVFRVAVLVTRCLYVCLSRAVCVSMCCLLSEEESPKCRCTPPARVCVSVRFLFLFVVSCLAHTTQSPHVLCY